MQDEVAKHTKKIYDTLKNPKYSFGEKVKEIIIEVFIIVFAVTLSIWFHSWSEHRHEQQEAKEFLRGLKDDLNKDIKSTENNKNVIAKLDSNYEFILSLKKNQVPDTVINKHLVFYLRVTYPNNGRYEGFKSSGKIGTIENDSLKENILVFYQQTIPNLANGENYINSLQLKILDLQIDKPDKMPLGDFVATIKMKSLLGLGVQNFEVNIAGYDEILKQAKEIIEEIDKETRE